MNILFYLRLSRIDKKGNAPVYYRVTINSERLEPGRYTGQKINPKHFINNRDKYNEATNLILDSIEQRLKLIYATQLAKAENPSVNSVMNAYDGKATIGLNELAQAFFQYCDKIATNSRLDKDEKICNTTVSTYRYKFKHIERYYKCTKKQMPSAEAFTAFTMQNIADWLREESETDLQRSTIARVVTVMKKITAFGYKKGFLQDDFLKNFTYARGADKQPVNLSLKDVQKIWTYPYCDNLQSVADLFLLQCYTGMYLKDIKGISTESLTCINDKPYLVYHRDKNGQKATIPLFEPAEFLLKKYNFSLPDINKDYYNQLLKRVGDKAGIRIDLTMKMGRKTFANIAKNYLGYSTTALAAMLGHVKEETQKYYSRPSAERVVLEFEQKAMPQFS